VMCTVSFLPLGNNDFILSSNRDINLSRKPAEMPDFEDYHGARLLYPRDGEAGGTWIGIRDNHRIVCLLNGAFVMHEWRPPYRKSRGIVVKDALSATDPIAFFEGYDLHGIEPFTLLLVDWEDGSLTFYEWVWDEERRHIKMLPIAPAIWSSTPLYDEGMKALRRSWFHNWYQQQTSYTMEGIRKWHLETGEGDPITDLVTKRGFLETVSLTSIEKRDEQTRIKYLDLIHQEESERLFT
ncbi:MAG: NRDE family protein, partial [Bacteroidota bacterium]